MKKYLLVFIARAIIKPLFGQAFRKKVEIPDLYDNTNYISTMFRMVTSLIRITKQHGR